MGFLLAKKVAGRLSQFMLFFRKEGKEGGTLPRCVFRRGSHPLSFAGRATELGAKRFCSGRVSVLPKKKKGGGGGTYWLAFVRRGKNARQPA